MAFSFEYKGIRSEDVGLDVLNINRSILPPNNPITLDIPGRAGSYFARSEYGMLSFEIEVLLQKQTTIEGIQTLARSVANFLDASDGLSELIFDDETDKSYQAIILDTTNAEQIVRFRRGTIVFVCPYPYAESLTDKEFTIDGFLASFTRATTAYKTDGTAVASGEIRYETDGVTIEEGTTNLLSADESSFETSTAGFVGQGATISRDIKHVFSGNYSLKVQTNGTVADEGTDLSYVSVSSSTDYTISVYAIANKSTNLKIEVIEYTAADVYITSTISNVFAVNDEDGPFVRLNFTITTTGTTAKLNIWINTYVVTYVTFWIDALQVEQKSYLTSWQLGGSTRNAENFSFPIRDYLKNYQYVREGTIEFKFERLHPSSGSLSQLFSWGIYSVGDTIDRIAINHGTGYTDGLKRFEFFIVNGSDTANDSITVTLPAITTQLSTYYVAIRWHLPSGGATRTITIDVYDYDNETQYTNTKTTAINAPTFNSYQNGILGSNQNYDYYVNAIYDDFRATNRYRTDAEILSAINATRPFAKDEDGVFTLALKEEYDLYSTNVSNVGTVPVNHIITIVLTGAATYIQVEHIETEKILRVEDTLIVNDLIVFNGLSRTVYKNGIVDMSILTLTSEFFLLEKDDNQLNITSDGTWEAKISYTPAYL